MKENRQKEKESGIGLPIISKAQRVQLQKKTHCHSWTTQTKLSHFAAHSFSLIHLLLYGSHALFISLFPFFSISVTVYESVSFRTLQAVNTHRHKFIKHLIYASSWKKSQKDRKTEKKKEKQTPRKRAYWIHRFSESSILSVHIHLLSTGGLLCLDIRALHSYSSLSHILLCSLPSSVA